MEFYHKKNELKKMFESGETDILEFKALPNKSFFTTFSAFSNTKGGIVLLGVNKKGIPVGIKATSNFLEDLTNRIVNKLSIYPEIEVIEIEEKRIIAFRVIHSSYLVSYEGRYYERVGNTTREMNQEKLKALLLRSNPWDSIVGDFSWEEIDTDTVRNFIQRAVKNNRLIDVSLNEPIEVILEKLELLVDGKLTNGAILLFSKNPQRHFINLCIRIGRFKTEITIIDDKWIKGNLMQQFEESLKIIKQLINVRYEIKGIEREDVWDYPLPAIREALLNALTHRDYFNIANFIVIKVYNDHIWFSNPGGLPEGITIEQLKKPHQSYLRNPLIAKILYLAGYIEQYGSGTMRMVKWLKEYRLPEPEYKEEFGGFSTYFYKDIYTEEDLRKKGLNLRQIKAAMFVKENGKITNKEYQELCKVQKRQSTDDLKKLEEKEIFNRIGTTGKGTYYVLKAYQRGERGTNGALMGHLKTTKGNNNFLNKNQNEI